MVDYTSNMMGSARLARRLSWALLFLMVVQSSLGILFHDFLYRRDSVWVASSWRANDLVTLFTAAPLLFVALRRCTSNGLAFGDDTQKPLHVWFGCLFYAYYNGIFYSIGAAVNECFLLYCGTWTVAVLALFVLAYGVASPLAVLNRNSGTAPTVSTLRARVSAVCLATIGTTMVAMWGGGWAWMVLTGSLPFEMQIFRLIAVADFTSQVPALFLSAYLLWIGHRHALLLGSTWAVGNALYAPVLALTCPFSAMKGIPGSMTSFPFWVALSLVASLSAFLLTNGRVVVKK